MRWTFGLIVVAVAVGVGYLEPGASAYGQIVVPGAYGDDGVLDPNSNLVIDLGLAQDGVWDDPNHPSPGHGLYDPNQWAVVFRYSSVNIRSGKTVTFLNHPSGAPVVWLVSGSVTIAGTVSLNGTSSNTNGAPTTPGPGGFRGGQSYIATTPGGGGFGPGGGFYHNGSVHGSGGSYGAAGTIPGGAPAPTYGNAGVFPLLGGSGGSAADSTGGHSGGAGGGAILIAAASSVTVSGSLTANGGNPNSNSWNGGGSGGAIRLIADTLTVPPGAYVKANGGSTNNAYPGGDGRIRFEMNHSTISGAVSPGPSQGSPVSQVWLWPDLTVPRIGTIMVADQIVPPDPRARFDVPSQDLTFNTTAPLIVTISAHNIPLDWNMKVRVVPKSGQDFTVSATLASGDEQLSYWQTQITLPNGFAAIQVRASAPPSGQARQPAHPEPMVDAAPAAALLPLAKPWAAVW